MRDEFAWRNYGEGCGLAIQLLVRKQSHAFASLGRTRDPRRSGKPATSLMRCRPRRRQMLDIAAVWQKSLSPNAVSWFSIDRRQKTIGKSLLTDAG